MRVPDPRNCSYGTEDDRNKCHQTQGQNGGVYDIHLLKIIDNFKHKPSNARECTAAVNTPQVLKRRRDSQTEPERWPLLSRSNFFGQFSSIGQTRGRQQTLAKSVLKNKYKKRPNTSFLIKMEKLKFATAMLPA